MAEVIYGGMLELEAAQDIIRFEVQYKYHKTFSLNQKADLLGNHDLNKYKTLPI